MGQKVSPKGMRIGVIKDWDARWYADKNYEELLHEDLKVRKYVKTKLFESGVSDIITERTGNTKLRVTIHTAKPGIVIGAKGSEIEKLRKELQSHQQTQQMLDESLQKLKQLSAEEIEAMHRQLQEQVRQTRQKLENLTQLNHIVRQENKDIRQKIQTAEETEKTVSKKIESLQTEIARQKELLKKKEQEIKQKKQLIKFAIDSSSSKKPLLAELDADGIAVFNPGANNRIDFKKTGNADAALREFNMYLAGVDKTEYYFSVAVKPNGFKYANSVLKMLKESKIERGFEILPDNQSTLFGENAL